MSNLPFALITGGSRGLGFETARQLGKLGYRLFIASRTTSRLEQAAQLLRAAGYLVSHHTFDMQDQDSIQTLVEEVRKKDVSIDVLINCAGVMYEAGNGDDLHTDIGSTASVLRSAERNVTDTIAINMIGTWSVTRALGPLSGARRPYRECILEHGFARRDGSRLLSAIARPRPASMCFTRTLAYEMRPRGILVNSVCPGWVKTNMGGPGATAMSPTVPPASFGRPPCRPTADRRLLPRRPGHSPGSA